MRVTAVLLAMLAGLGMATPLQAQQRVLSANEVEFFAETLTMAEACRELGNMRIRRQELLSWVNTALASVSEDVLDEVLSRRDIKMATMRSATQAVQDMPQNGRRERAIGQHYGRIITRCEAMTNNSIVGEYFQAR